VKTKEAKVIKDGRFLRRFCLEELRFSWQRRRERRERLIQRKVGECVLG
jgi:hypothetical protein